MAYTREEYERKQMYDMMNAAYNHNPLSSINQSMAGDYISKESRIKELQNQIARMTLELEKLQLDDPHKGPTNRELNKHESLKNAWSEYLSIRKLVGL